MKDVHPLAWLTLQSGAPQQMGSTFLLYALPVAVLICLSLGSPLSNVSITAQRLRIRCANRDSNLVPCGGTQEMKLI